LEELVSAGLPLEQVVDLVWSMVVFAFIRRLLTRNGTGLAFLCLSRELDTIVLAGHGDTGRLDDME
jgi:hypothetical protein